MGLSYLFESGLKVKEADLELDQSAVEKIRDAVSKKDTARANKIIGALKKKFGLDDYQVFAVFKKANKGLTQDEFADLVGEAD